MTKDKHNHENFSGQFEHLWKETKISTTQFKLLEYSDVLEKLNKIFSHFDKSQGIPVYGLGAKIGPKKQIHSNCFSLSGDFFNPFFDNTKDLA
jgi:hypothetical protein